MDKLSNQQMETKEIQFEEISDSAQVQLEWDFGKQRMAIPSRPRQPVPLNANWYGLKVNRYRRPRLFSFWYKKTKLGGSGYFRSPTGVCTVRGEECFPPCQKFPKVIFQKNLGFGLFRDKETRLPSKKFSRGKKT
jgi:hypothetical protein